MSFATGDSDQPDMATISLSCPVVHDGDANDYVLDALVSCLTLMASPNGWNPENHSQTADQAAAYGQSMLDSLVITWP